MEEILLRANPEETRTRSAAASHPDPNHPKGRGSAGGRAPADAALVAVVLLLVAVEEVAHAAVVLAEEALAALAALLGLPGTRRGGTRG